MEKWDVSCSPCRATPSCCLARTPAFPSPLAVLSNGTMFLYLLDLTRRKQYAVLRFASQVLHVSNMYAREEPDSSVVLCCLASGEVATFCITTVVKRVREREEEAASATTPEEEDLFVSLLGIPPSATPTTTTTTTTAATTAKSQQRSGVISASEVTVGIGLCPPALGWNLVSAAVLDDCMVMCRRCAASGETSHLLLRSGRCVPLPTGGRETVAVPSFVAARQLQVLPDITTTGGSLTTRGNGVVKGGQRVERSPAFAIVQSESHAPRQYHTITSELFAGLFGLKSELSKNPILLIGCQNGNIYFTNFRSRTSSLEEESGSTQQEVLHPLHSLEQPVVGIHSAHFPVRKPADAEADPFLLRNREEGEEGEGEWQRDSDHVSSDVHNAILFLGLRGRISICYAVPPPSSSFISLPHHQPSLGFLDFHVPAPLLSSALIQDHCLLYSTLGGALYQVCLRQRCTRVMEGRVPRPSSLPPGGTDLPLRIPETSFKFPEKLLESEWAWHLLLVVGVGSSRGREGGGGGGGGARGGAERVRGVEGEEEEEMVCLCCSLDGRLATLKPARTNTTSPTTTTAEAVVSRRDSAQVGREVKQCLQAIQARGERQEGVAKESLSLGAVLTELKRALDVLCSCQVVGRSSDGRSPLPASSGGSQSRGPAFSCSFLCSQEELGTSGEGLGVVVELRRRGGGGVGGPALGKGWSLVVMTSSSSGGGRVTSKSLPISGLACRQSVTLRVDLDGAAARGERAGHLGGVVSCFVHYDPHHLCQRLQRGRRSLASGGVSVFLARKEFDLLDYLRPHRDTSSSSSSCTTDLRERLSSLQLAAIKSLLVSGKGRDEGDVDKQAPPSLPPHLPHTCTLTIPHETAVGLIRSSKATHTEEDPQRPAIPGGVATRLLAALLPASSSSSSSSNTAELAAGSGPGGVRGGFPLDLLTSLDGEFIRFRLSEGGDKTLGHLDHRASDTSITAAPLKLEIHASSASSLARVTSAVHRRRQWVETESEGLLPLLSRQEACGSLQRLRHVLDEAGELVREVSKSYRQQQRRGADGCSSGGGRVDHRTLRDWRDRTVAVYCKLREWPA